MKKMNTYFYIKIKLMIPNNTALTVKASEVQPGERFIAAAWWWDD